MDFVHRPALLPKRRSAGGMIGAVRRWVTRLRLYIRRLAAIGANAPELRGLLGFAAALFSGIAWVLLLLRNFFLGIGKKLYRGAAERLEMLIARIRSQDRLRGELYRWVQQRRVIESQRQHGRVAAILLMTSATMMIVFFCCLDFGFQVRLNGELLGMVESRDTLDGLVDQVEKRLASYRGEFCSVDADFTYRIANMDHGNRVDEEALADLLFASVPDEKRHYELLVDGELIGASRSRAPIELMLRRILLNSCNNATTVNTSFVNDIQIKTVFSNEFRETDIEEMEKILTENKAEEQIYSVRKGDTVSAIGLRFGMKLKQIKALNPDLNESKIHVGQQLLISQAVPRLSVQQIVTEHYTESVPFETEIQYDDSMYSNKSKYKVEGVPGEADVVADVTYVNGVEKERNIISYEITRQPVTAIKVVGTKTPPRTAAKGNFIKPCGGRFSSGYGYRPSLRDTHTGVDYAASVGTKIWAADGGTVIWAAQKGNYGKYIIIDHGNGYTTYYCHCSKLLVSKGDKVAQGDIIANVGKTGRVTGPHLHFEVRYKGKPQNPLKYVSK